jgi:hypothetical protein
MWLCVTINVHDNVLFLLQKNTNMWLCVIILFYIPGFVRFAIFSIKISLEQLIPQPMTNSFSLELLFSDQ